MREIFDKRTPEGKEHSEKAYREAIKILTEERDDLSGFCLFAFKHVDIDGKEATQMRGVVNCRPNDAVQCIINMTNEFKEEIAEVIGD